MDSVATSHPDRAAATLANVDRERSTRGSGPFVRPGAGSRDCRIDLKLLAWRANRAIEQNAEAKARLAEYDSIDRADLWAGTVRDGTARGFASALEEAIALATEPEEPSAEPAGLIVLAERELRRKKDLLVKSGGARVRFTRRDGLLFVDRDNRAHSSNCLRFEARRDLGTLDGFVGEEGVRPRLFSAQFLRPTRYETAPGFTALTLSGRIGRGAIGWDTELRIEGLETEPALELEITIDNAVSDWRLRARFLGIPPSLIAHECADVREVVESDAGGFTAFTLVRACGKLAIDGELVAVPSAQCHDRLVHRFQLGRQYSEPSRSQIQ